MNCVYLGFVFQRVFSDSGNVSGKSVYASHYCPKVFQDFSFYTCKLLCCHCLEAAVRDRGAWQTVDEATVYTWTDGDWCFRSSKTPVTGNALWNKHNGIPLICFCFWLWEMKSTLIVDWLCRWPFLTMKRSLEGAFLRCVRLAVSKLEVSRIRLDWVLLVVIVAEFRSALWRSLSFTLVKIILAVFVPVVHFYLL